MKKRIFSVVLTCIFITGPILYVVGSLYGQTAPAAASVPEPAQVTEAKKAFDAKLTEYKQGLKKLRTLKEEYQTAKPERKDAITSEFNTLLTATEKLQKSLIPAALTAYESTKGNDPEIAQFLMAMLQWMTIGREDYETAYTVAKAILANKIPEGAEALYAVGAYAAFNTMHLDDADAWFKIADEKKSVEKADPQQKLHLRETLTYGIPMYRKLWAQEQEIRAKEAKQDLPRVRLKTTRGDIVVELFKNEAPNAVGNFLTLVAKKYYNDTPFHRVLPYFMAQGGDPTGTGTGGPGHYIPCECGQKNARMHFRGTLSMAHAGPNTGGSQFFLTFVPTFFLNGKHTAFGRVVEGMDVLSDIQRIDPEGENLPAPDKILEATIIRGEPFEFKKLPAHR